jgi:hypothetical protein
MEVGPWGSLVTTEMGALSLRAGIAELEEGGEEEEEEEEGEEMVVVMEAAC